MGSGCGLTSSSDRSSGLTDATDLEGDITIERSNAGTSAQQAPHNSEWLCDTAPTIDRSSPHDIAMKLIVTDEKVPELS